MLLHPQEHSGDGARALTIPCRCPIPVDPVECSPGSFPTESHRPRPSPCAGALSITSLERRMEPQGLRQAAQPARRPRFDGTGLSCQRKSIGICRELHSPDGGAMAKAISIDLGSSSVRVWASALYHSQSPAVALLLHRSGTPQRMSTRCVHRCWASMRSAAQLSRSRHVPVPQTGTHAPSV